MKKLLVLLVLAGAAAAGVYYWRFAPRSQSLSESQLTFATLQIATMRDIVSATGVLKPRDVVVVACELPGVAENVLGKVNQVVTEGAVLVQLDDRRLRLKVEEAENGLSSAKAAVAQAEAQLKAAQAGVLAANAKVAIANTAIREAQLALEMAVIKAPTPTKSGTKREYLILESNVHQGQMVGPQAPPLFTLASGLDRMEVHAQVAEGDVIKVKPGQVALFAVTNYADDETEFRGTVKEIRPQATNIKGAVYYDTVIEVVNQRDPKSDEWQLRPGMTVSVDILRREHKDVWRAPTAALNFHLEDAYLSDAAKARLAEWKKRADHVDWQALWIWDAAKHTPWPLFVRINGLKDGAPGLKDSEGNEILEWEPGRETTAAPSRVIIAAPPAQTLGFFDKPANIKVS